MPGSLTARLVALGLVVLLVLGVVTLGPAACQKIRSLTAQNRVTSGQLGASQKSGSDAVNTVGNVAANESASEATTRTNEKDIRNAQGASDKVNPAVRDAGFASLCKRPAFRNSPTGRLRCPAPGGVAQRR